MPSNIGGWRETLQAFLEQLGWSPADFARQTELTSLRTTGAPLQLSKDSVSLLLREKNPRLPRRRERYIELVDLFTLHRMIRSEDEANRWLAMVGHKLTEDEIKVIFRVRGIYSFSLNELPPQLAAEIETIIKLRARGFNWDETDILISRHPEK